MQKKVAGMSAVVVDTNVAIVANGNANHINDEACIDACIEALAKIFDGTRVVIDDGYRIIDEYIRNLCLSGQPGIGDKFLQWVHERQACTEYVEQVHITPRNREDDFEEFPDDSDLQGFDYNDRKFVAVALTSQFSPTILNASDTDWYNYHEALRRCGCKIEFLCPQLM